MPELVCLVSGLGALSKVVRHVKIHHAYGRDNLGVIANSSQFRRGTTGTWTHREPFTHPGGAIFSRLIHGGPVFLFGSDDVAEFVGNGLHACETYVHLSHLLGRHAKINCVGEVLVLLGGESVEFPLEFFRGARASGHNVRIAQARRSHRSTHNRKQ